MKWSGLRLAVLSFLLLAVSCFILAAGTARSSAADPVPYGQAFQRDYVSSADGTALPCSIYAPPANAGQPMPVWVDLHALDGPGGVRPDWQAWAATRGMMVLSPWGRNFRGLWMDGLEPSGTQKEPCLFDDYSALSSSWQRLSGNWALNQADGCYKQNEVSSGWSQAVNTASSGADYSVSVDLKETGGSASLSAMGVTFRRQANGDCYWVDLANSSGSKLLRLYKYKGGAWSPLAIDDLGDSFDLRARHNLKVMVFADTIQVRIDGQLHELDNMCTYHKDTSELPERLDSSFSSGTVGLCGLGGTHQFDNFRVQNEFLYGERDVLDSLDQFLEEFSRDPNYRIDPGRIYLSGFSVGGTGAWNIGLHYPDLFAAIHPSVGETDLQKEHDWMEAQRPDQSFDPSGKPPRLYQEQDSGYDETLDELLGGRIGVSAEVNSRMHENSARYVLENALNMPVRIEHPAYDTITPNSTDPMTVWWSSMDSLVKVTQAARTDYAQSQYVWNKLHSVAGLYNCRAETAMFGENGEDPADPANIWDNTRHDTMYQGGGHGCCYYDWLFPYRTISFFERSTRDYGAAHNDPAEVAYKTYDSTHNRAWWLTVNIAEPDTDRPGLARVSRDRQANVISAHVKNVATTVLDIPRMGMKTGEGDELTINVDSTTTESEPVTDTRGATDLRLAGSWDTSADYGVTVNGVPAAFGLSPCALSINGLSSSPPSTVEIIFPAGRANMLPNPGFEDGPGRWATSVTGGGQATFELNTRKADSHTGNNSARIADPAPGGAPYAATWTSERAGVIAGKSYSASAFVKTRALRARNRVYENGKYSTAEQYNSFARLSLRWLDRDGAVISEKDSPGLTGTSDWTPLEVTDTAPAQAQYASVALKTAGPDSGGTSGSAWFDDVALRRGYAANGQVPSLVSVSPQSGPNGGTVSAQISGAGFESGAAVRLRKAGKADIAGSSVRITAPGTMTCVFNLTGVATGAWDVEVTNPNGELSALQSGFSVRLPGPQLSVSSCAPASGAVNTVVSITALTGAGFQQGAAVRLEKSGVPAIDATKVVVASSTRITASVDLTGAQTGSYDVVVSNPDGQVARLPGGFTVNLASSGCGSGAASGVLMLGLAMGLMAAAGWYDRGRDPLCS